MNPKLKIAFSITTLMCLGACAFKGSTERAIGQPLSGSKSEVVQAPRVKLTYDQIAIQWVNRESKSVELSRQIEQGDGAQKVKLPIVLPQELINELSLSISATPLLKAGVDRIEALVSSDGESGFRDNLTVTELKVGQGSAGDSRIRFKVSGIKDRFEQSQKSKLLVLVRVLGKDGDPLSDDLTLELLDPPTDLDFISQTRGEFERLSGPILGSYRTLTLQDQSMRLLRVIRVINRSDLAITAHFPLELQGQLVQRVMTYYLNTDTFAQGEQAGENVLGTKFYAIPLQDGVQGSLSSFMAQASRLYPLKLKGKEERLLGIYVAQTPESAAKMDSFESGTSPKSHIVDIQPVKSRTSQCINPLSTAEDVPVVMSNMPAVVNQLMDADPYGSYFEKQGWPGDSKTCWLHPDCYLAPNRQKNPGACNTCADFDDRVQASKDDLTRKFCWARNRSDRGEWVTSLETVSIRIGEDFSPVELRFNSDKTPVRLEYDLGVIDGKQSARVVGGYLDDLSIQWAI